MSSTRTLPLSIAVTKARPKSLHRLATSMSMVASDVLALSVVYLLAVLLRYLISPVYSLSFYLQLLPGISLFLLAFLFQGLYPGILLHPVEEIRRVTLGMTAVFLLIGSATFITRDAEVYSRSVFLVTWTAGVPAVLLIRQISRRLLSRCDWWGVRAIVLGSGEAASRVAGALQKRELGLRVVGILSDSHDDFSLSPSAPKLGEMNLAPQIASGRIADFAIVAMPELSNRELGRIIQTYCRGFRHILIMPDLVFSCSLGVSARDVGGELGIEVPQRLFHRGPGLVKRTLDLTASLLGLLALSPLFLIIAAIVKLTSSGSIFFGHDRHGCEGRIFKALKFRTMVENGGEVLEEYFTRHPEQLSLWLSEHKIKDDPRVTAIGKWLRRYSLDELPQLFNVFFGQMSLVGPRPIVPNEIDKYAESFDFCTSVRPGITGLWQVSGRNNLSFRDRIRFNEYYIRNWSVWLDIYILCRTVGVVLGGEGAY